VTASDDKQVRAARAWRSRFRVKSSSAKQPSAMELAGWLSNPELIATLVDLGHGSP
jgi:hypothetical protein